MKTRTVLLFALVMAMPLLAAADNTETFTFANGTFDANSSAQLVLSGGQLTGITGPGGTSITGADIGTVNFSSGVLWQANVTDGGNILPGGSVNITGNGTDGAPNGVLFTGTFNQVQWWTVTTLPDGTHQYTFSGSVTGTDGSGNSATGQVAFSFNTGTSWYEGTVVSLPSNGTATLAVPEPGEMSLLGMGLIGLMGAIRRKVTA